MDYSYLRTLYYVEGNTSRGIAPNREAAERWLRLAAYGASGQGELIFSTETSPMDAKVPFGITEYGPVLEIEGHLPGGDGVSRFQFLARWVPGMIRRYPGQEVHLDWRDVEELLNAGEWRPIPSGFLRSDGVRLVYDID